MEKSQKLSDANFPVRESTQREISKVRNKLVYSNLHASAITVTYISNEFKNQSTSKTSNLLLVLKRNPLPIYTLKKSILFPKMCHLC